MAASDARLTAALARAGMGAVTAQQGLAALSSVLGGGLGFGALCVRFCSSLVAGALRYLRHLESRHEVHADERRSYLPNAS